MLDRRIAGITCLTVLTGLETYLAGDLDDMDTERIEAHLAGCDQCTRFGGVYAGVCRDLHELLSDPDPVPVPVIDRLRDRLAVDLDHRSG